MRAGRVKNRIERVAAARENDINQKSVYYSFAHHS